MAGQVRAYPFSVLQKQPIINDQIGEIPVAVFFDKMTLTGTTWDRRLGDGTSLTFETDDDTQVVLDSQTGSAWDTLTGQAIGGSIDRTELVQIPITYAFWFAWMDYYPDGTVYTLPP